jgi:hypothetical protein
MSTLDSIAKSYGTDKSSDHHNYCVKYEKYLPFKRYDILKILEIGILYGQSLKVWKDYFYRSQIIGIDILPECKKYEEDRIKIEIGSQTDKDFLLWIVGRHGPFDMIIDDGSHMNSDVIYSFEELFKMVRFGGGVYVVEDCATSYWEEYEGGYKKETSVMEYFKRLTDDVNYRGLKNIGYERGEKYMFDMTMKVQPDCRIDIESINFLNGIIIITKR